jgi:hypothetical protein
MSDTSQHGEMQHSWMRRFRIPLIVTACVVLLGAAGLIVFSLVFQDTTTPIPVADAIDNFDGSVTDGETPDVLPEVGVYTYVTEGRESIKTLLTSKHEYPSESALTVTKAGCGVRMEWTPLEERSEFLEVCRVDGGLALMRYGGVHEFFGQRDERFVTCPERTWLIPPPGDTTVLAAKCEGKEMTHTRTTVVVGVSSVVVDGTEVVGTEVRTEIITSGESTGTTTSTMIFADNGLLLYWNDVVVGFSDSIIGKAEYNEQFLLTLTALVPSR